MREKIEEGAEKYDKVMIVGDFNARIGEEIGIREEEGANRKKRKSKDKVVNSEGRKLLKICDELGLKIWNGRAKNDKEGEITYVGGTEECLGSVIDLVITVDRGNEGEIDMKIVERIESDHLIVAIRQCKEDQENEDREEEKQTEEEGTKIEEKKNSYGKKKKNKNT
ncbi:Protein of unknown function [Cotesia congregata]|uniref:Craniofacial development protein 2-like n=1 Tax=Cotesia congregata TaxID=51543 RepID=A0A8J2HGC0_COTCN|nr:Protein of unknown function [Cotesia congregata]